MSKHLDRRRRTPRAGRAVGVTRRRRLVAGLIAMMIAVVGLLASPISAFAASSGTLWVAPGNSFSRTVTRSELGDVVASASFTVPDQRNTYLAVQMRSDWVGEGYRAKARIQADGSVSVSFSRVDSNVETFLGATTATGLTVSTGQTLDLEGMVTGTDPVQLSVRAWVDGTSKPDWQQTYSDSSDSAITDPGGVRLWGYLSQNADSSAAIPFANASATAAGSTGGGGAPTSSPTSTAPTSSPTSTAPTSSPTSTAPTSSPTSTAPTAPPPAGVCAPGSEETVFNGQGSADLSQYGEGNYNASAELWGVNGYNYSQKMGVCRHGSWYVDVTTDNSKGDGAVKAYPSMRRIYHDWSTSDFSKDPLISTFPRLNVSFAQTDPTSCSGCIYDDAFDVWINGIASSGDMEMMIWTHNVGQTPYGTKVASNIPLAGHTWDLWAGGNDYVAFVPTDTSNISSGTFDLKQFTSYLSTAGRIPVASRLGQISYGVETVSTGGVSKHWDFTQFSVDDGS